MSVTVEDVLAGLVAHAAHGDFRKPDPLVLEARDRMVGKPRFELREFFGERLPGKITTASGRGTRSVKKSARQVIVADALSGMPRKSWAALLTIMGDVTARDELVGFALKEARRSRRRDRFWPDRILRRRCRCHRAPSDDYLEDLVQLAILHYEYPEVWKTYTARADWFGVSRRNWERVMEDPFRFLSMRVWGWNEGAIKHIVQRLKMQRQPTA